MAEQTHRFNFQATCIGSVPFLDIEGTCRDILHQFPFMPFWPQFVKRSFLEDMSAQYCEGLPLLEVDDQKKTIRLSPQKNLEWALTEFYEHFLAQDLDYFAISPSRAPGLYALMNILGNETGPKDAYVKGQTVGPVTFCGGILDSDGKPLLHHADLLEAMANGLAIKALWQVRILGQTGRKPIVFLDEPFLSGFGSAFSPIQRHEVIHILQTVIHYLREYSDTLIGIHCCGNTDWAMIMEAGPDIINFDAFEYMEHFLLYQDELVRFIRAGGSIAWGIVPTFGFTGNETEKGLFSLLEQGMDRIHNWDIDPKALWEGSILTPACGMGSMAPEAAEKSMDLLVRLSGSLKKLAHPMST